MMNHWMTVLQTQANEGNFSASVLEDICEQYVVGISDNKIQEILSHDVKDTSMQEKVSCIAG